MCVDHMEGVREMLLNRHIGALSSVQSLSRVRLFATP